jgi:hypothetical protein
MLRGSVIALALLLSGRSLWTAFVDHQMSADAALLRLLIAVPVAALLLGALRMVTGSYKRAEPAASRERQPGNGH